MTPQRETPVVQSLIQHIRHLDQERATMQAALRAMGGPYIPPRNGKTLHPRKASQTTPAHPHSPAIKADTPGPSITRKGRKAMGRRAYGKKTRGQGHSREFKGQLYDRTMAIIQASPTPMAARAIAQQLRAQKQPDTSIYYHLIRGVRLGTITKDRAGLYSGSH